MGVDCPGLKIKNPGISQGNWCSVSSCFGEPISSGFGASIEPNKKAQGD